MCLCTCVYRKNVRKRAYVRMVIEIIKRSRVRRTRSKQSRRVFLILNSSASISHIPFCYHLLLYHCSFFFPFFNLPFSFITPFFLRLSLPSHLNTTPFVVARITRFRAFRLFSPLRRRRFHMYFRMYFFKCREYVRLLCIRECGSWISYYLT